jgi:hypothetical protein
MNEEMKVTVSNEDELWDATDSWGLELRKKHTAIAAGKVSVESTMKLIIDASSLLDENPDIEEDFLNNIFGIDPFCYDYGYMKFEAESFVIDGENMANSVISKEVILTKELWDSTQKLEDGVFECTANFRYLYFLKRGDSEPKEISADEYEAWKQQGVIKEEDDEYDEYDACEDEYDEDGDDDGFLSSVFDTVVNFPFDSMGSIRR